MKILYYRTLLLIAGVFLVCIVNAQNVYPKEKFPNTTSGSGTFTGDMGTWTAALSGSGILAVSNGQSYSSSNALEMGITSNTDGTHNSTVTSPVINLTAISCEPSPRDVVVKFRLYFEELNNSTEFTLGVNASSAASPSYTSVFSQNATQLNVTYNTGTWYEVVLNLPSSYRTANFRLQLTATKTGTGNENNVLWIDDVIVLDPAIPDFSGTPTVITDVAPAGASVGDVYRYNNVATYPTPIYADVTIEAIVNASLDNIDNNDPDAGTQQRFQPRIAPNPTSMTNDQEGYFQFAISYKKVSDNSAANFFALRYRHFDMDGSANANYSFRETGWITGHSSFLVNSPSNLTDGGNVPSGSYTWKKALGETAEHDGISFDPAVFYTAVFSSSNIVRFRLGYLYDKITAGSLTTTIGAREYSTEFGCFSLDNQITLPVKLLNFSGTYRNNVALLNWETENQQGFDHFEIERSTNGNDFTAIASKPAQHANSREQYQYPDDLGSVSGSVFYYRLKIVDKDGQFKYSNVIMIRKEQKNITGMLLSPNPVTSGMATVRLAATSKSTVDFRIIDMAGRVVLRQQNKVYEGNNSIAIDNLNRLQPGTYTLQLMNGDEMQTARFTIVR